MKQMLPILGLILVALSSMGASCTQPRTQDSEFRTWFLISETNCKTRFMALPIYSERESNKFMNLTYSAYLGRLSPEDFAERLADKYPGFEPAINCLANALPQRR